MGCHHARMSQVSAFIETTQKNEKRSMIIRGLNEADEIIPGLWMGCNPTSIDQYDCVFSVTTHRTNYQIPVGKRVYITPFEDEDKIPPYEFLVSIVDEVYNQRNIQNRKVLVHCTAGINRSGLIVAMVMEYIGWEINQAIAHIRKTRGDVCLYNKTFTDWLTRK